MQSVSWWARGYAIASRAWEGAVKRTRNRIGPSPMLERAANVGRATLGGVALGLMSRADLHWLDARAYDEGWLSEGHTQHGLFDWERRLIDAHFAGSGRLVVLGG